MPAEKTRTNRSGQWTFLSNHAHVLVCLRHDRRARVRDIADAVGITERAVLLILADLEAEGIIERVREGRRNVYDLNLETPLRHPLEAHRSVQQLLDMVEGS
jgi:DNA-binding MarR family transcriptional regulator